MTEYDYSPEAYERYLATQNRIANWVDKTEQHRAEFQSGNAALPDLPRSGPGPVSHSKNSSPSPSRRQHPGQSHPKQVAIHPASPESDSSSDSYYEDSWPAQQGPAMALPQQPGFHPMQPPMMIPPTYVISPHRVSHHHRHRSHDQRRSRSHQSPAYYTLASPPLSPGYQYTYSGGYQGYVMMPQYGGSQVPVMSTSAQPPRSAPVNVTTFTMPATQPSYFQPQQAWPTYGNPPPAYSRMSTPIQGVPTYQTFATPQPAQPSHLIPPLVHQRVYDLSKPDSDKYSRRSVG